MTFHPPLSGSCRFWGSWKTDLQGRVWRCETSVCSFCSVGHCYLHGSDTIYLTVHLVLLRQGKLHKTSLAHQHFHCVLAEPPFTWSQPRFNQSSPSLPLPQTCLFLQRLLLVSLSSCFHFVFFVEPRKLKLSVFVDETSAAS